MSLVALTGFLAGSLHVVSGPDHLTAVAPLAAASSRASWQSGLRWAGGHSLGVVLIGCLLYAFRSSLPLEAYSNWAERLVGVTLCGIGVWTLRRALSRRLHIHTHAHGDSQHVHFHLHSERTAHPPAAATPHAHAHAAFGIGTLHGLAGSSHFFAVLPTLALPSLPEVVIYLTCYTLGTMLAMAGFAELIGRVVTATSRVGLVPYRILLGTLAFSALGTGVYWIWATGRVPAA
jgi:hypothetical protein